jgi:hypothetical protein
MRLASPSMSDPNLARSRLGSFLLLFLSNSRLTAQEHFPLASGRHADRLFVLDACMGPAAPLHHTSLCFGRDCASCHQTGHCGSSASFLPSLPVVLATHIALASKYSSSVNLFLTYIVTNKKLNGVYKKPSLLFPVVMVPHQFTPRTCFNDGLLLGRYTPHI